MKKCVIFPLLVAFLLFSLCAYAEEVNPKIQKLETELMDFAKSHIVKSQVNIRPNINNKELSQVGDEFCCRYVEVDIDSLTIEIRESKEPKIAYIGQIVYLEHIYEAKAGNKEEAATAEHAIVKSRRITELARYSSNKWQY